MKMQPDELENEYCKLIQSLFDKLRRDVESSDLDRPDAEALASMLATRTGFADPSVTNRLTDLEPESWSASEDCYEDNKNYNKGWQSSSWCGDNG
jgi:hypothetical protein